MKEKDSSSQRAIARMPEWPKPGVPIAGAIDKIDPISGIHGWVIDSSSPEGPLELELVCGACVIARVSTDRPRPDVTSKLSGVGSPGFVLSWDALDVSQLISSIAEDPKASVEIYLPSNGTYLPKPRKNGFLDRFSATDLLAFVGSKRDARELLKDYSGSEVHSHSTVYREGLPSGRLKLKSRHICIVTTEFHGLFKNGGIGTANTGLALELAGAGWDITVLYIDCDENGPRTRFGSFADVADEYKQSGITLEYLADYPEIFEQFHDIRRISYAIYLYMMSKNYSAIYFNECGGQGFYTVMAGKVGTLPNNPAICVVTHGSNDWTHELNSNQWSHRQLPIVAFMEKKCIQYATAVISPSKYLLEWMKAKEWDISENVFLEQNIVDVSHHQQAPSIQNDTLSTPVSELIFFGRQEVRKGIRLFCDALDLIASAGVAPVLQITFLGKFCKIGATHSGAYILTRSKRWNMKIRFLSNLGQKEALEYLRQPGRLAVIPSLAENSPCVVAECLQLQIPFVATNSGGTGELVAEADRGRCLVPPDPKALAQLLLDCINYGQQPARMAIDQEETRRRWRDFHTLTDSDSVPSDERKSRDENISPLDFVFKNPIADAKVAKVIGPLVSICIVHYNRPALLKQAFESALAQTYTNIEVVVIDDGSDLPDAAHYLHILETTDFPVPVRVVHQKNRYLGAARNLGARNALGDYFLFVDDDNLLMPTAISDLVTAAKRLQADIVTGVPLSFYHTNIPNPEFDGEIRMLPLGGCVEVGFFENCFGDANALVSRKAYEIVGGFHEEYGQAVEDWEFFAKATLAGLRLEMSPKPSFWYRVLKSGMFIKSDPVLNARRIAHVYHNHPIKNISRMVEFLWEMEREQLHRLRQMISESDESSETMLMLSAVDPESKEARRLLVDFMVGQRRTQDALDFALHNDVELLKEVAVAERNKTSNSARNQLENYQLIVRNRLDITPYVVDRAEAHLGLEDELVVDSGNGTLSFGVGQDLTVVLVQGAVPAVADVVFAECSASGDTNDLEVCLIVCDSGSRIDFSGDELSPSVGLYFSLWQDILTEDKREFRVPIRQPDTDDPQPRPKDMFIIARGKAGRGGWGSLTWSGFAADLPQGPGTSRSVVVPSYTARRLPKRIIELRGAAITRVENSDESFDFFVPGYPTTLHPLHGTVAAIRLERVVPPGAIGARALVSVANDQAHPIQFGLWIHPSSTPIADQMALDQLTAFSGWLTVTEKHVMRGVEVKVAAGLEEPHDIYLATRVVNRPNVWFCHALLHDIFTLLPS